MGAGRRLGLAAGILAFALGVAAPVRAQDTTATPPAVPILTIDPERLFSQSAYGQALVAQVQADTETLAAENRTIESDLTAEEQDLAARRPAMDPDAFRAEAEAFDIKVQDIRRAQDAKEQALQAQITAGREAFFLSARPVLGELMLSMGAGLILDRRSVFLSAGSIDITDKALTAIDATFGTSIPAAEGGN